MPVQDGLFSGTFDTGPLPLPDGRTRSMSGVTAPVAEDGTFRIVGLTLDGVFLRR